MVHILLATSSQPEGLGCDHAPVLGLKPEKETQSLENPKPGVHLLQEAQLQ